MGNDTGWFDAAATSHHRDETDTRAVRWTPILVATGGVLALLVVAAVVLDRIVTGLNLALA